MSHWNYRLLARRKGLEIEFGFYEVHYENDIPIACTENTVYPSAYDENIEDPIDSIKWQLNAMKLALEKPVINYDNFPNEYVKHLRKKKLIEIEKCLK